MRITAGMAKGMVLAGLKEKGGFRPSTERIREAIFSSLADRVAGADVLDLFAGTGALGFEAASRGATSVVSVEHSRTSLRLLRQNLANLKRNREVRTQFSVLPLDVYDQLRKFVLQGREFTLVFADPPYRETSQKLLSDQNLPQVVSREGLFILESPRRKPLKITPPWHLAREGLYGDTRLSFFTRD